jgi:predicted flap endonuclease-1-like 5' DNA nuclease
MSSWIILLIIVIVIFVVWWALLRNAKTYKPDFELHAHEEEPHGHDAPVMETPAAIVEERAMEAVVEEAPAAIVGERAIETAIAVDVQPDDLTVIEGIGPKVNQLLHNAGIQTFAQLANTSPENLKSILKPAGLAFINPESWIEQAGLLSEGKMEAFEDLTERLKGGRRVN